MSQECDRMLQMSPLRLSVLYFKQRCLSVPSSLMRFDVTVRFHERITRALEKIADTIALGGSIMTALETLQAQVQANNDLAASCIQLIQGLAAQIETLKLDPVALQALADSLKATDQALSDALVANTPAETPPETPTDPV